MGLSKLLEQLNGILENKDEGKIYYHGSPEEEITPKTSDLFGDFLFFSHDYDAAASHGGHHKTSTVFAIKGDFSIISTDAFGREFDMDDLSKWTDILSDVYGVTIEQAYDLLINEIDAWDSDLEIDDNELRGDLSWDIQRYQAEIAISNGWDGLELRDEHGTSYMFPAAYIKKYFYNKYEND